MTAAAPTNIIEKPALRGFFLLAGGKVTLADGKPSCARCRHYFITHDVNFPYGCRAMSFKSKQSPQNEIVAAAGAPCVAFEPRPDIRHRR